MEVLERLARANSDADALDGEFAPMSFRTLDRDSLSEGLTELLAVEAERVRKEEQAQVEALRRQAEARTRQQAEALRWERELIERKRAERLERRIEQARVRAADEAGRHREPHQEVLDSVLKGRAQELALKEAAVKADVIQSKKRWTRTSQVFLAAAALVGVVWVSALGNARSTGQEELAQLWQESKAQELADAYRVAELEAEIDRHVNLTESERALLQDELNRARVALHESKKEREELDRRRPVEGPSKMAGTLTPIVNTKKTNMTTGGAEPSASASERVASDVVPEPCSAYDPLCFDL